MFLYMFFLLAKKQSTSLAQDEITKSAQEYKKDLFPKYKQEKNVPKNFEMSWNVKKLEIIFLFLETSELQQKESQK